jgi:hypothetical protein
MSRCPCRGHQLSTRHVATCRDKIAVHVAESNCPRDMSRHVAAWTPPVHATCRDILSPLFRSPLFCGLATPTHSTRPQALASWHWCAEAIGVCSGLLQCTPFLKASAAKSMSHIGQCSPGPSVAPTPLPSPSARNHGRGLGAAGSASPHPLLGPAGREVWIRQGPLFRAVRASMAVPAVPGPWPPRPGGAFSGGWCAALQCFTMSRKGLAVSHGPNLP